MELPNRNIEWPPAPFDKSQTDMKIWSSWYEGDTGTLAAHYQKTSSSGGIAGIARRLWWGRPDPAGQNRTRLHIPLAADVARTSADLLFSEMPTFLVGEGSEKKTDTKAQEIMAKILDDTGAASELLEAAELGSALGGTYMRLSWDKEMSDYVQLDTVDADGAIPEFRRGRLISVIFWQIVSGGSNKETYRFLERHVPGAVEYALYKGTSANIGIRVPLQDHPVSAWAAELVDAEGRQITGIKGLTAGYAPNVRPNRAYRNTPQLAHLGRSDFDQLVPLFDAADEAYSSMMRDLRLGKARAFIDDSMLKSNGPGQGASFDEDQELYARTNGIGSLKEGKPIQMEQPEIRHAEHRAIIEDIISQTLRTAGYSAASFGDDPMIGNMTATEVNTRREMSERTRNKKIQYWKRMLQPLATTALEAQKLVFGNDGLNVDDVSVRFPTQTNINPQVMSATIAALSGAEAISTERKVRMLNPNWDSDDINREVDLIHKEYGRETVSDPTAFKG